MSKPVVEEHPEHELLRARDEGRRLAGHLMREGLLSSSQIAWVKGFAEEVTSFERFRQEFEELDGEVVADVPKPGLAEDVAEDEAESHEVAPPSEFEEPVEEALRSPQATLEIRAAMASRSGPPAGSIYAYSLENPFTARIEQVFEGDLGPNAAWQVFVDIQGYGVLCLPGALLGITPSNDAELVRHLLRRLRANGQEAVNTEKGSMPVWQALLEKRSLTTTSQPLLVLLAQNCRRRSEAEELQLLSGSARTWEGGVFKLLRRFPSAQPPMEDFINTLDPLVPLFYPIAGTSKSRPHIVEALVTRSSQAHCLSKQLERGERKAGDWLPIFIKSQAEGHLPRDPATPVMMIAAGAAVACALFFLAERAQTRGSGRNWLFTSAGDGAGAAPYSERLAVWQASRLLTRFDVFGKLTLEQLLATNIQMVRAWITDGCYLYLFGSLAQCQIWFTVVSHLLGTRGSDSSSVGVLSELRERGRLRIVVAE